MEQRKRVIVTLAPEEYRLLDRLAAEEERIPEQQATYIVRNILLGDTRAMKYEYAVLTWVSDRAKGECHFSHRPKWDKIDGPLTDALRRLGDEGWQLVSVTRLSMGNMESKYHFQRLFA